MQRVVFILLSAFTVTDCPTPSYYAPSEYAPSYTIGYSPGHEELKLEILKLQLEIEKLKLQKGQPLMRSQLHATCAKCHSDGNAKGNFVIFRNGNLDLSYEKMVKMICVIREGVMPPGGALNEQEKGVLLDEICKEVK